MKKTLLLLFAATSLLLTGCSRRQQRTSEDKTAQLDKPPAQENTDLTVLTGTTRTGSYPMQPAALASRLDQCYRTTEPGSAARTSCVTQAEADYTLSKSGACQQADGFNNYQLAVERSAGNAQSPLFYKDGTTLYYPVQISSAETVSCDQDDYELYLYQYDCARQEVTQLVFFNDLIEDNLRMCGLKLFSKSDDALLAQLLPYEHHGGWLDTYLIIDTDDGNVQAINMRGASSLRDLGVLADDSFAGFDQFTQRVEENTAPYYSPDSTDPGQTPGTGITTRGRIEVDNIDTNLQGSLRHVYQPTTTGTGPYMFITTEANIDFLTRTIGK